VSKFCIKFLKSLLMAVKSLWPRK